MKKNLERIVATLVLVALLAGCAPAATPMPTATNAVVPTAAPPPTETPVPPTPTATPLPTATVEKKTVQLPISFDQPIPPNIEPINWENASQIQALGLYPGAYIETVRFSGDGKWLFTMHPEQVNVFSLDTKENVTQLNLGGSRALATSREGQVFAVAQGQAVHVFQRDGKELFTIPNPAKTANQCADLAVSPNGSMVAVDCYETFAIYSIPAGKPIYTWDQKSLTLHGGWPQFSPDGKYISASYAAGIGVWKVEDWSKVNDFPAGFAGYFTPDDANLLVIRSGRTSNSFQVWQIAERKQVKQVKVGPSQWNFILTSYSAKSTGELVLPHVVDDGSIYYTYLAPGRKAVSWSKLFFPQFEFVTRPSGPALFVSNYGSDTGCWLSLSSKLDCVKGDSVILGSNKRIYLGTKNQENGLPKIDFKESGQQTIIATISGPFYYLSPAGLDPAHQLLFYSGGRDPNYSTAYLENMRTNGKIKSWSGNGSVGLPSYSSDGKYAAFFIQQNPKHNLVIFDLENSAVTYEELFSTGTSKPVFSPDDKQIAYVTWPGRDARPDYVETMTVAPPHQKTRFTFELDQETYPFSVAFSVDGSMLAVGFSDGMVRLVNLADGSVVHEWQAHHEPVTALVFSADSTLLATSGKTGIIKLWGVLDQ